MSTDAVTRVNLLVLGKGTVGGEVFAQLAAQRDVLAREEGIALELVGVVDRRASVLDRVGIDPRTARERLDAAKGREGVTTLLDALAGESVPVLVDCTAADGMESTYEEAFRRGVHVVTANKKPLAGETSTWRALKASARRARRRFRFETTVGASLPVVGTLQDLVRTGDRVRRIEGSLSGTLGFLSTELAAGARLSEAVRRAKERGFTEPHPAEDLSGADAARKAVILAREAGAELAPSEVEVTPFVPGDVLAESDLDAFFARLEELDGAMGARVIANRSEGRVLRYLVTVDLADGRARASAAPAWVGPEHPASGLHGSESFVAFHTARYREHPLVVRGAGAGGALTAAGVLADVVAIAHGAHAA